MWFGVRRQILFLLLSWVLFFQMYSCSSMLGLNRSVAKRYYQKGLSQLESGNTSSALHWLKKATQKYRKYSSAYYELAKIYLQDDSIQGRINADWALQRAVRYDPGNVEYRMALAKLNLRREFYHTAESEFKRILAMDSTQVEAWYSLGFIHEQEMLHLQHLINPDSSGVTLYFTEFADKELEKTLNYYRKANKTDPDFLPVYYRLGFVFYELSDWPAMIAIFQEAIKYHREDKNSHLYLALAYHRNRQYQLANTEYQIAWQLMDSREQEFYTSVEPLLTFEERGERLSPGDSGAVRNTDAFWQSRDPMFLTDYNERLMEHFARIAYANLRFSIPHKKIEGWQTDRGKVYIRYGPPLKQTRTRAWFNMSHAPGSSPVVSAKETWNYPGFQFVFEDRFLNRNFEFKWGMTPEDDYLDIYRRTIRKMPEFYRPDFGGKIYELPVIVRQFEGEKGLTSIYLLSGIPVETVNREMYPEKHQEVADLQKGIFVFTPQWKPVLKKKQHIFMQPSISSHTGTRYFLSLDSLRLKPSPYYIALEYFDNYGKNLLRFVDTVKVIDCSEPELGLSDIILADEIRLKAAIPEINRSRIAILPNFGYRFLPGQNLYLYYEIYHLQLTQAGRSNFKVDQIVRRLDARGSLLNNLLNKLKLKEKVVPEVVTTFTYQGSKTRENHYRIVQFKDYEPGRYELVIRVQDLVAQKFAEKAIRFEIVQRE